VNGTARAAFAAVDSPTGSVTLPFNPTSVPIGGIGAHVNAFPDLLVAGGLMGAGISLPAGLFLFPEAAMTGIPGPPSLPMPTVTGNSLSLAWFPSALGGAPTDYFIEAALAPDAPPFVVVPNGSANPVFAVSGVPPGLYYLRVRARNGFGTSVPSLEIGVAFGDPNCTAPPLPTGLGVAVNGSNLSLEWENPVGFASHYTLRAGSVPHASNIGSFPLGSGNTFTTDAPRRRILHPPGRQQPLRQQRAFARDAHLRGRYRPAAAAGDLAAGGQAPSRFSGPPSQVLRSINSRPDRGRC
jgi:hypothetical protein